MGPYSLGAGKTASHTLVMPRYVGSVRTMVIAGNEKAYGFTEKTTPVRKPLMVVATLPRVLGPGENVGLPVTVFAMEKSVKERQSGD
ncbi:MAG: alpha-2-macroglobulin family protein [Bacteroidales bacterium]